MLNKEYFQYIGLIAITYALMKIVYKILRNLGIFWFGWYGQIDFRQYGTWAVVTGGTDGMGRVFVEEFAQRGLNVVVISNEREKFANQKKSLEERYSIETKFIYADFSGMRRYTINLCH